MVTLLLMSVVLFSSQMSAMEAGDSKLVEKLFGNMVISETPQKLLTEWTDVSLEVEKACCADDYASIDGAMTRVINQVNRSYNVLNMHPTCNNEHPLEILRYGESLFYAQAQGALGSLYRMAIFFKNRQLSVGNKSIWEELDKCRKFIEDSSLNPVTIDEQKKIQMLLGFVNIHDDCQKTGSLCCECAFVIGQYMGEVVAHDCCKRTLAFGTSCGKCSKKLRAHLCYQLAHLIRGFTKAGVPRAPLTQDLALWAYVVSFGELHQKMFIKK